MKHKATEGTSAIASGELRQSFVTSLYVKADGTGNASVGFNALTGQSGIWFSIAFQWDNFLSLLRYIQNRHSG